MEINTGIRKILTYPYVYSFYQKVINRKDTFVNYINNFLINDNCKNILDVGCGPADIVKLLPDNIKYIGLDYSKNNIEIARKKFKGRGEFYCCDVSEISSKITSKFDVISCRGLLHHLEDKEAEDLFINCKELLSPTGKIVTYDPCFMPKQKIIARMLLHMDRGKNIRFRHEYKALAYKNFKNVEVTLLHKELRLPYNFIVMTIY